MTEAGNHVVEGDESNNVKAVPITLAPDDTDLEVNPASAPASPLVGDIVPVAYTVKNLGSNAAPALWYDSIYLSDTPNLTASSRLLKTSQRPGQTALAGGGSYIITDNLAIPYDAPGSTQYLLVLTDVYSQQAEADEANNVKAVPFSLAGPDLVLTSPQAPASAALGVPFQVSYTVTNLGSKAASKTWTDAVYISDSPILDGSAQFVFSGSQSGQVPLAVGASYTPLLTVTLPATATGNRDLLVVTAYTNQSGDMARDSNVFALPIKVAGPDLVVTAATAPASASVRGQVQVSWTVQNQGGAAAPANWPDKVYLSDKPTFDFTATLLGSLSRPNQAPLAAGDSYSLSQFFTIDKAEKTGNRYLHIVTDGDVQVKETNESNIVFTLPITITAPDLVITQAAAPASAPLGSQVTVSWTGLNQSSFEAPADWTDRVYLSA